MTVNTNGKKQGYKDMCHKESTNINRTISLEQLNIVN